MKSLFANYMVLLVLLALTMALHQLNLGAWQTPLALFNAAIKAALVAWIFMELGSSGGLIGLAASAGILWLVFFYMLAGLDVFYRSPGLS